MYKSILKKYGKKKGKGRYQALSRSKKKRRKDIKMHYGKKMKKSSKKKKNYVCDGMDVSKAPKVKKEPTEKVM